MFSQRNPRTDSFYLRGSVLAVGHNNFCEELARNGIQVTEADGNVSFQPVVQRTDPDLTVLEDVEQILLNEGLDSQVSKRKLKLCSSSQQNACSELETQDNYNEHSFFLTQLPMFMQPFILMTSHNIWQKWKVSTKLILMRLNPTRLMMHWQRNMSKPNPICQLRRFARQLSNQNVAQRQQIKN